MLAQNDFKQDMKQQLKCSYMISKNLAEFHVVIFL